MERRPWPVSRECGRKLPYRYGIRAISQRLWLGLLEFSARRVLALDFSNPFMFVWDYSAKLFFENGASRVLLLAPCLLFFEIVNNS